MNTLKNSRKAVIADEYVESLRIKVREAYTRDEVKEQLQKEVDQIAGKWGKGHFYEIRAKEISKHKMAAYDCGEVIPLDHIETGRMGAKWISRVYSDGTADASCVEYVKQLMGA